MSKINQSGWNQGAYQAWVNRHGLPRDYALTLKENPRRKIEHYLKYMEDVKGKKIANLLGSKGNKAVSFALLGADVTVVDISRENRKYAMELAEGAGVKLHYIVSDLMEISVEEGLKEFDYVILELGVLHYFVDLLPVFNIVRGILKTGGTLILRDFHPIVSKLLHLDDTKMVASGNYFDRTEIEVDVAFWKLIKTELHHKVTKNRIRRWTLGEIVTSLANADLTMKRLEEEQGIKWAFPLNGPEGIEDKIPGLFTIVAEKR